MVQAAESGKPEAIQEKMAVGRLEKFFKGYVLMSRSSSRILQHARQVLL